MKFLELLRRKAPTTVAELTAALAEAEQAARDADAMVEKLTAERARLLLDGDDTTIDRIEAELAAAARSSDRAGLAIEELKRRLQAATDAETAAELDRVYAAGMAAQDRGCRALKKYEPLARKLVDLLAEVDDAETEIARSRAMLEAANDPRRKELVAADRVVRPCPEGRPYQPSIVQLIELPAMEHGALLWPPTNATDQRAAAAAASAFARMREAGSQYVPESLRLKTIKPEHPYFPAPAVLRGR